MPKTVELITVKEILEELNISRNHFYLNYKPYVIQIPTLGKELKFDKQSVIDFHKKRKLLIRNSGFSFFTRFFTRF